jgi:hypothetical protein
MSDNTVTDQEEVRTAAPPRQPSMPVWLLIFFVLMAFQVVVAISYAVTMNGFAADGGYFLAYGSLCTTVPVVAEIDRFAPFLLAALWAGCIYLGVTRSPRFRRAAMTTSLISIAYGALTIVAGPFSFRVGPAAFDPATLTCGRWPRDVTQSEGLQILQLDWFGLPITWFGLGMVFISLALYVYLRTSPRLRAIYPKAD